MTISGTIGPQGLAPILQMLARVGSKGTLSVTTPETELTLEMGAGLVRGARSDLGPRLGDFLVELGMLDRATIDCVVAMQRRKRVPQRLGDLVVEFGLVGAEDALAAANAQIRQIAGVALAAADGSYEFAADTTDGPDGGEGVAMDALLLDSVCA